MIYMMKMWIEIEPKLPYALTPPIADNMEDEDNLFYILDCFNAFCYNGDESAGKKEFVLATDVGEAEQAIERGDIESYPSVHKVKIKNITSILAQRA